LIVNLSPKNQSNHNKKLIKRVEALVNLRVLVNKKVDNPYLVNRIAVPTPVQSLTPPLAPVLPVVNPIP